MRIRFNSLGSTAVNHNLLRAQILLLWLLSLLILLPAPAAAALPPRPGGDQPAGSGDGSEGGGSGGAEGEAWAQANGAFIKLQVQPAPPDLWTVVQWQNGAGEWFDVAGWQGRLAGGQQVWWVHRDQLGQGPFRWLVYRAEDRAALVGSAQFYLPAAVGLTQSVEIRLPAAEVTPSPPGGAGPQSGRPAEFSDLPVAPAAPGPTGITAAQPELQFPAAANRLESMSQPSPTLPEASATPAPPPTGRPAVEVASASPETPTLEAQAGPPAGVTAPDPAAISLHQSVSAINVEPGQVVTWTVTLHNPTGLTAKGLMVSDILPPELRYLGSKTSRGRLKWIGQPRLLLVYVGDLPAGARLEILIYTQVLLSSAPGSTYTNLAMAGAYHQPTVAASQLNVLVQTPAQSVPVVFNLINPRQSAGRLLGGLAILVLGGLIWRRAAKQIKGRPTPSAQAVKMEEVSPVGPGCSGGGNAGGPREKKERLAAPEFLAGDSSLNQESN